MNRPSRFSTVLITILTGIALVFGMGCYGSFPLTRAVHEVNDTPANDAIDSVVFWLFLILPPAYPVALTGDVFVLNVMEFWTHGDVSLTRGGRGGGRRYTLRRTGENRAKLVNTDGEARVRATFRRLSDKVCQVRGPSGKLRGRMVRDSGGTVRLEDAEGNSIREINPDALRPSPGANE